MGSERSDLAARYQRYLACCNERRFDQLDEFVSEQVSGSAPVDGLASYVDGVRDVCTGFPDYRWDLQELVIERDTVAARLIGRGTHTAPSVASRPPVAGSRFRNSSCTGSPTVRSSDAGVICTPWYAAL